ncbi:hypothetical protein [Ferruginibacter sp.]
MKKIIIGLVVFALLVLGAAYLFIPNIIKLKSSIGINATRNGLNRMLLDKANVAKWWPGKVSNDSFYLNDFVYTIHNSNISVMPVFIADKNVSISTSLFFIEIRTDFTNLEWVGVMASSYNPIKRIAAYFKANKIETDMQAVLNGMEAFYRVPENIYGFEIKKELVTDSILIQTTATSKGYPTNELIYNLVDKLSIYAVNNNAKKTGYPMLNINETDSLNFTVKVAIPVDKPLPNSADILQKRMLGRGNILVTEVKGGNEMAEKAIIAMKKYADDYKRTAPAIPFYSLITDRLNETDSSKWVTKIYYPVM